MREIIICGEKMGICIFNFERGVWFLRRCREEVGEMFFFGVERVYCSWSLKVVKG